MGGGEEGHFPRIAPGCLSLPQPPQRGWREGQSPKDCPKLRIWTSAWLPTQLSVTHHTHTTTLNTTTPNRNARSHPNNQSLVIGGHRFRKSIVFFNSKRKADMVDDFLFNKILPCTSIHSDRTQREREDAIAATPMASSHDVAAVSHLFGTAPRQSLWLRWMSHPAVQRVSAEENNGSDKRQHLKEESSSVSLGCENTNSDQLNREIRMVVKCTKPKDWSKVKCCFGAVAAPFEFLLGEGKELRKPETPDFRFFAASDPARQALAFKPVCRSRGEEGHMSKECEKEKLAHCRDCEEYGQRGGRLSQTRGPGVPSNSSRIYECFSFTSQVGLINWSKVKCRNCGEMDHTVKKCTKPAAEEDSGFGDGVRESIADQRPRAFLKVVAKTTITSFFLYNIAPGWGKVNSGYFGIKIIPSAIKQHERVRSTARTARNWSKVKCRNCGEMGHTVKKCTKPATEENSSFGDGGGFDNSGFDKLWCVSPLQTSSRELSQKKLRKPPSLPSSPIPSHLAGGEFHCWNCEEYGHAARDCPKPKEWSSGWRSSSAMTHQPTWTYPHCWNCEENGHPARDCLKPKDWSKVIFPPWAGGQNTSLHHQQFLSFALHSFVPTFSDQVLDLNTILHHTRRPSNRQRRFRQRWLRQVRLSRHSVIKFLA
ncbi:hypothetical protein IWZ01DRAFT_487034 [Phyllosticta capitalensis]